MSCDAAVKFLVCMGMHPAARAVIMIHVEDTVIAHGPVNRMKEERISLANPGEGHYELPVS